MGQNAVRVQQDQQHQRRPLYVVSPRDALGLGDVVVRRRLPRAAPDHGPRGNEHKTPSTILRHQNNLS